MEIIASIPKIQNKKDDSSDYSHLIARYSRNFCEESMYLLVGDIVTDQGWVLHLSVIRSQLQPLLDQIVPELIKRNAPFRLPKNEKIVAQILDGSFGSLQVGKLVTIYSKDNREALQLAKYLVEATQGLAGPNIPTDYKLSEVVFTRFESYRQTKHPKTGEIGNYITVNSKTLLDKYSVPFKCPAGIQWPFDEIAGLNDRKPKALMNDRYKITNIIKRDVKGSVMQGLYFKSFMKIKKCIIKEGKNNMWVDDYGRSIRDRLTWQYDLYNRLNSKIPIPQIFDIFHENDNTHLAMEFINGNALSIVIDERSEQYKYWPAIPRDKQIESLDLLLKVINIIADLHREGIVHRDITPPNFIIGKKSDIFLIDMELAYSLDQNYPTPPFQLGTMGFMSPEQEQHLTPTVKEDIYAIGALITVVLTNIYPLKLQSTKGSCLHETIYFLTQDEMIADLIEKCLNNNPDDRPDLSTIQNQLRQIRSSILSTSERKQVQRTELDASQLKDIVNSAIEGLSGKMMMTEDNIWTSGGGSKSNQRSIQYGLHEGLAGVLYLLAKAKASGSNIDSCSEGYQHSWDLLRDNVRFDDDPTPPGLFNGTAGFALAEKHGLAAGLIESDATNIDLLRRCFNETTDGLNLANGAAGTGLALLQCKCFLEDSQFERLHRHYLSQILSAQKKDGSWQLSLSTIKEKKVLNGLANGNAGILYYLLSSLRLSPADNGLINAIEASLLYLDKTQKRKTPDNTHIYSVYNGTPGIALCYIKAYQLLRNQHYKLKAERILRSLPHHPISNNFSQASGISGLGEVYLEAYKILKQDEWFDRSTWIASLLKHTFQKNKYSKGFWYVDDGTSVNADLMTGNSGIIHFLIRYLNPDFTPLFLMEL